MSDESFNIKVTNIGAECSCGEKKTTVVGGEVSLWAFRHRFRFHQGQKTTLVDNRLKENRRLDDVK